MHGGRAADFMPGRMKRKHGEGRLAQERERYTQKERCNLKLVFLHYDELHETQAIAKKVHRKHGKISTVSIVSMVFSSIRDLFLHLHS